MSVSTCQSKTLTALEREYVLLTQNGIPVVAQPYHYIAEQLNLSVEETLAMTKNLLERGIIRRIAAVPNHYKLGYKFNGMTVWDIDDKQASKFGDAVGKLPFVSHCYLRPRQLPSWNFNLFAMVHGKTPEEIEVYRSQIKDLLADVLQDRGEGIKSYNMLTSTKILKKTGLRLKKSQPAKNNNQNAELTS